MISNNLITLDSYNSLPATFQWLDQTKLKLFYPFGSHDVTDRHVKLKTALCLRRRLKIDKVRLI